MTAEMSVGITSLSSVSAGVFSPEAPRPKRGVGLYGTGTQKSPQLHYYPHVFLFAVIAQCFVRQFHDDREGGEAQGVLFHSGTQRLQPAVGEPIVAAVRGGLELADGSVEGGGSGHLYLVVGVSLL